MGDALHREADRKEGQLWGINPEEFSRVESSWKKRRKGRYRKGISRLSRIPLFKIL
jgi:hypothetical protein